MREGSKGKTVLCVSAKCIQWITLAIVVCLAEGSLLDMLRIVCLTGVMNCDHLGS